MVAVGGRLGAQAAVRLQPLRRWLLENLCTDVFVDADHVVEIDGSFLTALSGIGAAVRCNGGQLRVRTSSLAFARVCAAAALNANLEETRA
jgi:anti-anti-sigma regulatory factor